MAREERDTREFVITRVINASRQSVFRAWTDPRQLAHWWGPHGFTNPVCELDVRPGGAWRIVMRSDDGVAYPLKGVYLEIVESERLVFTDNFEEHPADWQAALRQNAAGAAPTEAHNTVMFEDLQGRTKLTIRTRFESVAVRDAMVKMGMYEGWSESLDRLEDRVAARSDREIVITRVVDAPRELVFDAWTDPEHIAEWWGPRGFTSTVQNMDVRPGGEWRFVMHGPDGTDYDNRIVHIELVRPERLVYFHGDGAVGDPGRFHVTVSLADQGGRTKVAMRSVFESVAECGRVKAFRAINGGQQTLQRLEEHLVTGERAFTISRVFDAPRELVWKAWTEPTRLAEWWGPRGFSMVASKVDFRPSGVFHYGMIAPAGSPMAGTMWGKFVYREILAPRFMVFVNSFSDEQGCVTRHPMSATWPLEVLNKLTLTERDGKTTLTLRGGPINATAAERATFEGGRESMRQGFGGTLDQLEAYLAGNP
jgi:uncharacterized protein YndB with AHSA1/START domain